MNTSWPDPRAVAVAPLFAGWLLLAVLSMPGRTADAAVRVDQQPSSIEVRLKPLPAGVRKVRLEADGSGGHWYVLLMDDGSLERVRPDVLAARLERESRQRRALFRLLNITSPLGLTWVALGLLGQVLFTGRMLLQWIASERRGSSVVPEGFWWLSLAGASMLLVYFVWRRDIVGVLGQSAGWTIYARNLWLIRRDLGRRKAA